MHLRFLKFFPGQWRILCYLQYLLEDTDFPVEMKRITATWKVLARFELLIGATILWRVCSSVLNSVD